MFQINSLFFGHNHTFKIKKFSPNRKPPDVLPYSSVTESFVKSLNLTKNESQAVINHLKTTQIILLPPKSTNINELKSPIGFKCLDFMEQKRHIHFNHLKKSNLFLFVPNISPFNIFQLKSHFSSSFLVGQKRLIAIDHLKVPKTTSDNLLQFNKASESNLKKSSIVAACLLIISSYFFWIVSRSTPIDPMKIKYVTLDDVIGCDEVKEDIEALVKFLKNPEKYRQIGARIPKGVLLVGDPGVGKTLITKAIASEAGVNIFSKSGSDFEYMFVGSGAYQVRKLFNNARAKAPSIILIDEIDSLCRKRTYSSLTPYANQTLNQFLAEMDGMLENENVIVIGTTNRLESMDTAAIRPGRFDQCIRIYNPKLEDRKSLFKHYISKVKHVDFDQNQIETIGRITIGKTGAHISHMVNEAGIIAVKKGHDKVSIEDILEADEQISMGLKRRRATDEKMNSRLAYKEAGRVLVSYYSPNAIDKIKIASIIERGNDQPTSSFVYMNEDIMNKRNDFLYLIDKHMGVRVAEELVFGADNVATDTYTDVNVASKYAKLMVQKLTFSDSVGIEDYMSTSCKCGCSNISDKKKEDMDDEIKKLLTESYHRVKLLISDKRKKLDKLAEFLLKYESLNKNQIDYILSDKSIINSLLESMMVATPTSATDSIGLKKM